MMKEFVETSAPGRLDFMGGIADYSGSLVLQLPIRERVMLRLRLRNDFKCRLESKLIEGRTLTASIDYRDLLEDDAVDYLYARRKLAEEETSAWIGYVLGCVLVLQKEKDIVFRGADIFIESEILVGKGVASSAALEIATMLALEEAFGITLSKTERAILAQRAENLVVGAPCGLMDQLTSACGESGKLLPIICQPDLIKSSLEIPPDISIVGFDSGIRHAVGGASYTQVRCAAFMGYSIIAHSLGITQKDLAHTRQSDDRNGLPFVGYLCNIPPRTFESEFVSMLPETLSGKDFIELYGTTIDRVTNVEPNIQYAIRACTAHPVYEQQRVEEARDMLSALNTGAAIHREQLCKRIGQLMLESHKSYSRCGLGSARTDELVNAALACDGIYGAKITGGGSGGTVCVLAEAGQGMETVRSLHRRFCEDWGEELTLFI